MNKLLLVFVFAIAQYSLVAQQNPLPADKTDYQETVQKINDLVHTKLDARFDYSKSYLYGKVWITLQPHFYATDSLLLDAKGMDIKEVSVVKNGKNTALKYAYNGMLLNIKLDRLYKRTEKYTIYIDYTAKPDELEVEGSAAITDAKGLYFINPRGEEKDKPTQIWTQGETEATSVWVPTIDKPNQKTTQEILMTVPAKYVTLSNGLLVSQKKNADGTRTDHWKMDLPHAPYLFFMGVGDYAVIKDSYKGKQVAYYVEKEYAPVARKIFGDTPEMMAFFSRITGVDYPWAKYDQIVGRDYVSGAMENTTATLHQESAQQDARELVDGNHWEDVISHELFHQWFGDYVTTESWSNLTLNESFANYSEYLWREYKYGKDAADAQHYNDMNGYLQSESEEKDLVRFHYHNREDMFDAVSYNKGGRILHMLRNYVGDSAFFKALNLYLTTNKFKSAEAQQLRLAFEEVTGSDLNWFFNQWYYGSGHPSLDVNYSYDAANKKVQVIVKQSGDKTFLLPVAIDVYHGAAKKRNYVWVMNATDTFTFDSNTQPDLVNFDGDKYLLALKKENKTLEEYIHQYKYAGQYLDRREAIDFAGKNQDNPKAVELLKTALNDKYFGLRNYAIGKLNFEKESVKSGMESTLYSIAQNDPKSIVRAAAIEKLGEYSNSAYLSFFKKALNDSSYAVAGSALIALSELDSTAAFAEAKKLAKTKTKGELQSAVTAVFIQFGDESAAEYIIESFEKMPLSQTKFASMQSITDFLPKVKNAAMFKRGVDAIVNFGNSFPESYKAQITNYINNLLLMPLAGKVSGNKEFADYIKNKISGDDKKGF